MTPFPGILKLTPSLVFMNERGYGRGRLGGDLTFGVYYMHKVVILRFEPIPSRLIGGALIMELVAPLTFPVVPEAQNRKELVSSMRWFH